MPILNFLLTDIAFQFHRHLKKSSDMQSLVVVSEEAISKGQRRIVAVTGPEAIKVVKMWCCH